MRSQHTEKTKPKARKEHFYVPKGVLDEWIRATFPKRKKKPKRVFINFLHVFFVLPDRRADAHQYTEWKPLYGHHSPGRLVLTAAKYTQWKYSYLRVNIYHKEVKTAKEDHSLPSSKPPPKWEIVCEKMTFEINPNNTHTLHVGYYILHTIGRRKRQRRPNTP